MNIKRFVAPDMRQAIRRVREEHGPDAVILKSQRGPDGVEVLSAIDFDENMVEAAANRQTTFDSPQQQEQPHAGQQPASNGPVGRQPSAAAGRSGMSPRHAVQQRAEGGSQKPSPAPKQPTAPKEKATEQSSQMLAVTRELRSIRGLLQTELASLAQVNLGQKDPVRAEIIRKLGQLGVEEGLSRRITERLQQTKDTRKAWREALFMMARQIPRVERDLLQRGGRVALYGPTGVGKTTTIAKLATLFAHRHGRQAVALIGTDGQRSGAQRELQALGQQLGVYTLAATSAAEVREALEVVTDRRLVLIDTMGMGQRDPRLVMQRNLMASPPFVEPWLVLAANIQQVAISDIIHHYAGLKPRGCVLTKIDECAALGGTLSAIVSRGLPLAFISHGQRVPEDIATAKPDRLVRRMVGLMQERNRRESDRNNKVARGGYQSEVVHG